MSYKKCIQIVIDLRVAINRVNYVRQRGLQMSENNFDCAIGYTTIFCDLLFDEKLILEKG